MQGIAVLLCDLDHSGQWSPQLLLGVAEPPWSVYLGSGSWGRNVDQRWWKFQIQDIWLWRPATHAIYERFLPHNPNHWAIKGHCPRLSKCHNIWAIFSEQRLSSFWIRRDRATSHQRWLDSHPPRDLWSRRSKERRSWGWLKDVHNLHLWREKHSRHSMWTSLCLQNLCHGVRKTSCSELSNLSKT